MKTQPAVIIGLIVTFIVGGLRAWAGEGFITSDLAESIANILMVVSPLIAGIFIRNYVWSPASVEKVTGLTEEQAEAKLEAVTATP